MSATLETICALLLLALVAGRAPAARRDPRARQVWLATVFGSVGLLCRGALVSPQLLDALLGGHNWLNLVQNLAATAAFWLGLGSISGLVRERMSHAYLSGVAISWPATALPFIFIQKGDHTDGRTFIVTTLGQLPTLAYVVLYSASIVVAAVLLLVVIRRRPSRFYIPFRIGAVLVVVAGTEEIVYAISEHWRLLTSSERGVLYSVFSFLFYPGLILILIASLLFVAQRMWQRRRALALVARIAPMNARTVPRPGDELAALYEAIVQARDSEATQPPQAQGVAQAVARAESLLSRYVALQIPSFRRAVTYRPES